MSDINEEQAAVMLCMLMVGADNEIKQEELAAMLTNPFFEEHVAEGLGPHKEFLKKYNEAKASMGIEKLEKLAVSVLNKSLPAFRHKTLALMTVIANADGSYDDSEKELIDRVSQAFDVPESEVQDELEKMERLTNQKENEAKKAENEKKKEESVDKESTEKQ